MPLLAFVMHTNAAMLESVNNPRLSRSMNDRFIQSCWCGIICAEREWIKSYTAVGLAFCAMTHSRREVIIILFICKQE